MACYHHQQQQAAAQCQKCGKNICSDCAEMYGVTNGEYAGRSLCYDCATQLVEFNVAEVGKLKQKTKQELMFIGIGMAIGGALGIASGVVSNAIILGLIGGSGLVALKALGRCLSGGSALASGNPAGAFTIFGGLFTLAICPIKTIQKVINRYRQIRQANEIIASDAGALREMRDYFAYTQVMERQGAGVDLARLAAQGSELYNNTYAKAVLGSGEKQAQARLRKSVVRIAANGEIIRSFDKESKDEAA